MEKTRYKILKYIDDYKSIYNKEPTMRQIKEHSGCSSVSVVFKCIKTLEKEGLIKKETKGKLCLYTVLKPVEKNYEAKLYVRNGVVKKIESVIKIVASVIYLDKKDERGMVVEETIKSKQF